MVANFSQEEIELPKATVLGVAEEKSESLVADINEPEFFKLNRVREPNCERKGDSNDFWLRQYIQDKLGHLSSAERAVMEPVL
jgi:hypothetical protein